MLHWWLSDCLLILLILVTSLTFWLFADFPDFTDFPDFLLILLMLLTFWLCCNTPSQYHIWYPQSTCFSTYNWIGWVGMEISVCTDSMSTFGAKNDIRDVGSTADLVLVFLVHLVHWYGLGWKSLCGAIVWAPLCGANNYITIIIIFCSDLCFVEFCRLIKRSFLNQELSRIIWSPSTHISVMKSVVRNEKTFWFVTFQPKQLTKTF